MMIELHNVTIGRLSAPVSAIVDTGNVLSIMGAKGAGKTTLLRALMGFVALDGGHISIDGELLTPMSARWFRQKMAYVPQGLTVPEGYDEVPTDYVRLVEHGAHSGKPLLFVDEPPEPLGYDAGRQVARLIGEATRRGATVVTVNMGNTENVVQL